MPESCCFCGKVQPEGGDLTKVLMASLRESFPNCTIIDDDETYYIDYGPVRFVFQFSDKDKWRFVEAWISTDDFTIRLPGIASWSDAPMDALKRAKWLQYKNGGIS